MFMLPLTDDGFRIFRITIDDVEYQIETYFTYGSNNHWMMNIYDIYANPLIMGICLVAGCPNLLKGQGKLFYGHKMFVTYINNGSAKDEYSSESLGNTLAVIWQLPGEEPYVEIPDRFDLVTSDNPRGL